MGLFLFLRARGKSCFKNLAVFSLLEAFLPKNKFFNFFSLRAEKLCIFAPLFENSKNFEND
jgi:hypothetical protein